MGIKHLVAHIVSYTRAHNKHWKRPTYTIDSFSQLSQL